MQKFTQDNEVIQWGYSPTVPPDQIGETSYYKHMVQGVVVTADAGPCGVLLWGSAWSHACFHYGGSWPVALLPGEAELPPLTWAAPYISSF